MIKDTMAKNAAATPTAAKIAALRELLPGCFGADGSLDFGRLREEYGRKITIRTGMEFGVQTHTIPQFEALFARYPFEINSFGSSNS